MKSISQQFKESVEKDNDMFDSAYGSVDGEFNRIVSSEPVYSGEDKDKIEITQEIFAFIEARELRIKKKLFLSICDNEIERLYKIHAKWKNVPNNPVLNGAILIIQQQIEHWTSEREIISN